MEHGGSVPFLSFALQSSEAGETEAIGFTEDEPCSVINLLRHAQPLNQSPSESLHLVIRVRKMLDDLTALRVVEQGIAAGSF